MSGHERERLSAYLDGELGASERDEVAQHLASCAECAAQLAELASVDDAARWLAADAPPGYFDTLPGRVRARLERRAPARRLPAWSWAVAAALLLAVVTPLTRRAAAPQSGPPAAPAAVAPQLQTATPATSEPQPETTRAASNAAPTPAGAADARKDQARKSEAGFAAPPAEADRRKSSADALQRLQPAAPPAPAASSSAPSASGALARADGAPARPERQAADEQDSRARDNEAMREAAAAAAEQKAAAAPEPQAKTALAAPGAAGARIEERVAAASTPLTDDEWRRLVSMRAQTADEWRRLREELRHFAEAWPESPHAAAARLRAVEAGHSAWRASGNPADEAVFRADAQAYLEREDARDADKARVRRLLR